MHLPGVASVFGSGFSVPTRRGIRKASIDDRLRAAASTKRGDASEVHTTGQEGWVVSRGYGEDER